MGCGPNTNGCDGHLYCFPGTWTPRHCFVCIYPLEANQDDTAAATAGCGVGCTNCIDHPDDLLSSKQQVWRIGRRFLRPKDSNRGRDAYGRLSDLVTGNPLPVPRRISFERAPCWYNDGRECFETICDCDTARGLPTPTGGTGDECGYPGGGFVSRGTPFPHKQPDCNGYTGTRWPPTEQNKGIDCRHIVGEPGPTQIDFGAGELCEPMNHRTHSCGANMMVLATARIAGSECGGGFQCFIDCDSPGWQAPGAPECVGRDFRYYADADVGPESRALWDIMYIRNNSMSMLHQPDETPEEKATVDAKSAVLQAMKTAELRWAGGTVRFDQLDNQVPSQGNTALGLYTRFGDSTGLLPSQYPIAMPIRVRLRQSGAAVDGWLRIHQARIELKLVVLAIGIPNYGDAIPHSTDRQKWVPYIRVRARAWTYLDFPQMERTLVRSWKPENDPERSVLLTAKPGPAPDGLPIVTPAGVDDVIVENTSGVQFVAPRVVEWRGWLGEFSFPKAYPVYSGDHLFGADQSNELRRRMAHPNSTDLYNGVKIPGWSDMHDSRPESPINTYGGFLQIGFSDQ